MDKADKRLTAPLTLRGRISAQNPELSALGEIPERRRGDDPVYGEKPHVGTSLELEGSVTHPERLVRIEVGCVGCESAHLDG